MEARVPAADRIAPARRVACCCGDRRQHALGAGDRLRRRVRHLDSRPRPARLVAAEASAPGPGATGVADAFAYPADGSLVRTGALSSSVSSRTTGAAGAQAVTDVLGVTLFNGEITAESVAARAKASAAGADAVGSSVTNLVVLGTPVRRDAEPARAARRLGLPDRARAGAEAPVADGTKNARGAVTALHVVLTAEHGGLPAGTEILVGHAEAAASTPAEAPPRPTPTTTTPAKPGRPPACPPKTREAAAEAARAGRAPEPAGLGLPARRRPTSRRRSRPRATSSRSTGRRRSRTRSARRARASAGTTARTSSPRSARRSSPSPTAPSSPSAGTTSAATGSGCATGRATSSTTPTSPPSRRSPSTATRCGRAT